MHSSCALLAIPATVSNPQLLYCYTFCSHGCDAVSVFDLSSNKYAYAQKYLAPLKSAQHSVLCLNVEKIPTAPTLFVSVMSQSKIPTRIYIDQQSNTSDG